MAKATQPTIKLATNWQEVYDGLAADFPEDAIERTKGAVTQKGYDTAGVGYQHVVNRFNEVCGVQSWTMSYKIVKELEGVYKKTGRPFHDLIAETTITVGPFDWDKANSAFHRSVSRVCVGGHQSTSYADALKGAITNSLKKTAALFGNGKRVYEGTLDDDNQPVEEAAFARAKAIQAESNGMPDTPPVATPTKAWRKEGKEPYECKKCGAPAARYYGALANGRPFNIVKCSDTICGKQTALPINQAEMKRS